MSEAVIVELDAQYRQLREECGVLVRSGRGKLLLKGAEAAEYLQGQLTNDVEALRPGEGCYAALLDRKGRMQADMRVLNLSAVPLPHIAGEKNSGAEDPDSAVPLPRMEGEKNSGAEDPDSAAPLPRMEGEKRSGAEGGEAIWVDTEPEALAAARRHLEMYKIGREVELVDVTEERAIISLIGPRSVEMAGSPALPEYAVEEVSVEGIECLAVGTALGIDLIAAAVDRERLVAVLAGAGAPAVSPEAAEILRIESGRPRFGSEMDTATMPAEAGIVPRAVNFEKGCYIGQETVARLHYKGKPNRHLRGLSLSAPAVRGSALMLGEKEVGKLGGSGVSPAHGPIGLALVRREAEPGAELLVGEDGVTARVVDLPFG